MAASIAVSAVLGILLLALSWMVLVQREQAAGARASMAAVNLELAGIEKEQSEINQFLTRPDNAIVLDQIYFLNELLHRKGVSWTKIFADLETVLPYNVRLIQVRPQITAENQIQLDIFVGAQNMDPVVQMFMKLESSPLFGKTNIVNQLPPTQNEPIFRCRLTVNYAQKL